MIKRAAITAAFILAFCAGGIFAAPAVEYWAAVFIAGGQCGGPAAIEGTISPSLIPIPRLRP